LPELGVAEKKTHSSSIDDDVALKVRRYFGHDEVTLQARRDRAAAEGDDDNDSYQDHA
jgi:hypothetical protein